MQVSVDCLRGFAVVIFPSDREHSMFCVRTLTKFSGNRETTFLNMPQSHKPAVVLVGDRLDSATALAIVKHEGFDCCAH